MSFEAEALPFEAVRMQPSKPQNRHPVTFGKSYVSFEMGEKVASHQRHPRPKVPLPHEFSRAPEMSAADKAPVRFDNMYANFDVPRVSAETEEEHGNLARIPDLLRTSMDETFVGDFIRNPPTRQEFPREERRPPVEAPKPMIRREPLKPEADQKEMFPSSFVELLVDSPQEIDSQPQVQPIREAPKTAGDVVDSMRVPYQAPRPTFQYAEEPAIEIEPEGDGFLPPPMLHSFHHPEPLPEDIFTFDEMTHSAFKPQAPKPPFAPPQSLARRPHAAARALRRNSFESEPKETGEKNHRPLGSESGVGPIIPFPFPFTGHVGIDGNIQKIRRSFLLNEQELFFWRKRR